VDPHQSSSTAGRAYGGRTAAQRAQARREQLISAAWELIAESGVATVSAEEVCRRAGLSKRYFYTDFCGKDDLLHTCADALYTRLREAVDLAQIPAPSRMSIAASTRALVHILASDPAAARLYAESPAFPRLRERQQQAIRDFSTRISVEAPSATGTFTSSDDIRSALAARIIAAGGTEAIIAWLRGEIECDEDALVATIAALVEGAAIHDWP
jgi:AcrR family transcriptional regulator